MRFSESSLEIHKLYKHILHITSDELKLDSGRVLQSKHMKFVRARFTFFFLAMLSSYLMGAHFQIAAKIWTDPNCILALVGSKCIPRHCNSCPLLRMLHVH